MTPTEEYQKTQEVLNKFLNREKYRKSALFHQVVQMLVRGVDPYLVIEQLITTTEDTQKAFEQYINRDDRPITFHP